MPLVHIHISEGKTDEKKQELMKAVTEAIEHTLDADKKTIRVFLHEFPRTHYMGAPV